MSHEGGIGDAPIEKEYVDQMNALAIAIDEIFNGTPEERGDKPRTVGFVLMMFKMGDVAEGRMNYISNADRADVLTALKEQVAHFEGRHGGEGKA